MNIKNILIIRPDAIGDCVLITPAITALKQRFPEAGITILAQELTRDLFSDEVITNVKDIRGRKFDLAVHYYNEMPYAWATKRAGVKYRLGDPSKFPVGLLYNLKYRQNWRDITKHDVEQNLLLLKPLGIEPPYPKLHLSIDPTALKQVETLLKNLGVHPQDKLAGLHLSTGKGNKPWSPKNFGLAADYLVSKGFKVVAAGQEKDHQLIKEAQKSTVNQIIDLSLKTNLKQLIALTSKYSLFVGVDTGPMHIAAALDIPIVHLSTSKFALPLRWGPWQTRHVLVRKRSTCGLYCHPARCPEALCAEEISFADAREAIDILASGGGNLTQEEAYFDWCKKSFSVMIAHREKNQARAEEIYKVLNHNDFYAVMVNTDQRHNYQKLFKENNTNILHAVDHSAGVRFQALISGKSLILPVLYVKDRPELRTFNDLFDHYQKSFAGSTV